MPDLLSFVIHVNLLLALTFQSAANKFLVQSISIHSLQEAKSQFVMDFMSRIDNLACQFLVQHTYLL